METSHIGWNFKRYTLLLLCSAAVAAIATRVMMFNTIGCNFYDRSDDHYMAYCGKTSYVHYDHAAFLFDLESGVRENLVRSNVLFLGSSRIQVGLSTEAFQRFASESPEIRPYLMGFGYVEQDLFPREVIRKLRPSPKVVVINADPFFTRSISLRAGLLVENPTSGITDNLIKKGWQRAGTWFCQEARRESLIGSVLCGQARTLYRSRIDGRWIFDKTYRGEIPLGALYSGVVDEARLDKFATVAEEFLSEMPVSRKCVVITVVPSDSSDEAIAKGIARKIGANYINAMVEGLRSIEGSHLDSESSERWSGEFLRELRPILERCL